MSWLLVLLDTFIATRGVMEPGRAAGSFWLTTEAAPGRFSAGEVIASEPINLPFRIDVAWRRIGPEAGRSMHITVADAVVLIRNGKVGLYAFDDARFVAAGWTPLPGFDSHLEHAISVQQDARAVIVSVDGKPAATFSLATTRASYRPGVGMKGAPGFRSVIYVRSLAITPL